MRWMNRRSEIVKLVVCEKNYLHAIWNIDIVLKQIVENELYCK